TAGVELVLQGGLEETVAGLFGDHRFAGAGLDCRMNGPTGRAGLERAAGRIGVLDVDDGDAGGAWGQQGGDPRHGFVPRMRTKSVKDSNLDVDDQQCDGAWHDFVSKLRGTVRQAGIECGPRFPGGGKNNADWKAGS